MTSEHWFGVEPRLGRDLFARWVYGARPSLIVAGAGDVPHDDPRRDHRPCRRLLRRLGRPHLSWVIDFFLSLPYLIFAIAFPAVIISVVYGGSEGTTPEQVAKVRFISLITVLSILGWAGLARLIRGQVLSLREREFISAARGLGVPTRRVLFRELLPNLIAPIVISASLCIARLHRGRSGPHLPRRRPDGPDAVLGRHDRVRADLLRQYPLYLWVPVLGSRSWCSR
jgi:peptide/nickel transport system permease protein